MNVLHPDSPVATGRYPRTEVLADGAPLTLAPMVPSDWPFLEQLLQNTPDEERRFFRREASDPERVERWCSQLDYTHILPLLAWHADRIAADAILEREPGLWTAHVGKVRLLVHSDFRRRGLGALMLGKLVELAGEFGLHKLVYECAADQAGLVTFLSAGGFSPAARLAGFIRDRDGRLHDMLLMVRDLHA